MKDHVVVCLDDLEAGKEIYEGRFCKRHGELVRYYCETENEQVCPDCISLKTCTMEHDRISLKDAATKQKVELQELTDECQAVCTATLESIQSIKRAQQRLGRAQQAAQRSLQEVKRNSHRQIDQMINKYDKEIMTDTKERQQEMKTTLDSLEKCLEELQETQASASKLIGSNEFEISNKYASISKKLQQLVKSEPETVDDMLGYLAFEKVAPMILPKVNLSKQGEWKLVDQFNTGTKLKGLKTIIINNENGDVCISDEKGKIQVFSSNGQVKHTLCESGYNSCCISPDNRYVTFDESNITHFDTNGSQLSKTPHGIVSDSIVCTAAVDSAGRIVLGWEDNKISIHYAEGSLMSEFSTTAKPYQLDVFCKKQICVSFWDQSLQILDYSGGKIREIHRPLTFGHWDPGSVCCSSQNEIFVINEGGDGHIYRFDQGGKYLDVITKEVSDARDVSLSDNNNKLYVIEEFSNLVKVFQRQ